LTLGLGPGFEMSRFIEDPGQISAPDPVTVVFDLGRPQSLFEAGISSQYGGQIVNAKLAREREIDGDWGRADAQLVEDGLGSGPYRIVEFLPEEQVVLERFADYWRGWEGVHFDRIVIRVVPENEARVQLLEQGQADIVDNLTPGALDAVADNSDVVLDLSYSNEVNYFILTVDGPLATPEARRALCYAFPYDEVIDGVYRGYGKKAVGPVAEVTRGFAPATFSYETDLVEAKRLLDLAGVAEGTTLDLSAQTGDANIDSAIQLFQANLAEVGISLNVELVDAGTFSSIIFRDVEPSEQPDLMAWYWWPAYNDAWNHLQLQVLCSAQGSAGTNAGYYCNPTVDELMASARDASGAAYDETLAEIQQILSRDDPPAIYFMQRQWPTALRADVAGFAFNPVYIGTYDFWRLGRR
jgi:peptide/nickel transport system substrate-binding protein